MTYKQLIKQILTMIRTEPDEENRYILKQIHDLLMQLYSKNISL